ncbi:MAG: DUF4214 domain-containing protein [Legionella sp.]|nr:DUF4214 domain-containing protein [Legionella sp.]
MNARVNTKLSLLAALVLGGFLAASSNAGAVAPWFHPGGLRPIPPRGDRNRDRAPERDRDSRRRLYGEQRFIRHLYQGFLNRQPSSNELRVWSERLGRDANPTELVQEFMDSDEFFIRETYRGLLGREPDASGMDGNLRALQSGQSRADVVEGLLSSEEFRNRLR